MWKFFRCEKNDGGKIQILSKTDMKLNIHHKRYTNKRESKKQNPSMINGGEGSVRKSDIKIGIPLISMPYVRRRKRRREKRYLILI